MLHLDESKRLIDWIINKFESIAPAMAYDYAVMSGGKVVKIFISESSFTVYIPSHGSQYVIDFEGHEYFIEWLKMIHL